MSIPGIPEKKLFKNRFFATSVKNHHFDQCRFTTVLASNLKSILKWDNGLKTRKKFHQSNSDYWKTIHTRRHMRWAFMELQHLPTQGGSRRTTLMINHYLVSSSGAELHSNSNVPLEICLRANTLKRYVEVKNKVVKQRVKRIVSGSHKNVYRRWGLAYCVFQT